MNKIGKFRCGEAKKFEFEFEGLEMNIEQHWEIEVWGSKKV